jgi:hypothetical protein
MKILAHLFRKVTVLAAIAAMVLFAPLNAGALAKTAADKRVDITVVVHGRIGDLTAQAIDQLVEDWLEVAHFVVVNTDGADILELEIEIYVDDDDDDDDGVKDSQDEGEDGDGKGFHIHSECGDWEDDEDVDTVDAIDDLLHTMINDFIEKFGH